MKILWKMVIWWIYLWQRLMENRVLMRDSFQGDLHWVRGFTRLPCEQRTEGILFHWTFIGMISVVADMCSPFMWFSSEASPSPSSGQKLRRPQAQWGTGPQCLQRWRIIDYLLMIAPCVNHTWDDADDDDDDDDMVMIRWRYPTTEATWTWNGLKPPRPGSQVLQVSDCGGGLEVMSSFLLKSFQNFWLLAFLIIQ